MRVHFGNDFSKHEKGATAANRPLEMTGHSFPHRATIHF